MADKKSRFLIGLFVITGTLLGVAIIIWIGASKYFQKGSTYVTFFDESVQGLQVDSSVKYRGVDVGRVERIKVAPDYKLVEVVMKVELEGDLQQNTVAQIKSAGITGIVFIELDRKRPGDPNLSPAINFSTGYPIIPSKPSELRQILSGVDEVIHNINQIDFKGLSSQFKSVGKATESVLTGKKMNNILTNIESTSQSMDRALGRIDTMIAEGKVNDVFNEARKSLSETRSLIAEIRNELKAMKLVDTAEKANQMVDSMDRRSQDITNELRITSENLQNSSESLQKLLDRLNRSPSDLIFSAPPPSRR